MPIYEYRCKSCGRTTSVLILRSKDEKEVRCSQCQGDYLVRVLSRVFFRKTEAQRLDEFDTNAPRDDSFFNDDRNVGLWAKKRVKELGVDLGPGLDETIEKARTGKILNDY